FCCSVLAAHLHCSGQYIASALFTSCSIEEHLILVLHPTSDFIAPGFLITSALVSSCLTALLCPFSYTVMWSSASLNLLAKIVVIMFCGAAVSAFPCCGLESHLSALSGRSRNSVEWSMSTGELFPRSHNIGMTSLPTPPEVVQFHQTERSRTQLQLERQLARQQARQQALQELRDGNHPELLKMWGTEEERQNAISDVGEQLISGTSKEGYRPLYEFVMQREDNAVKELDQSRELSAE
ncbi:hypothetical protein BC835DRAFT_1481769, partial [Cytidiella melzeri]